MCVLQMASRLLTLPHPTTARPGAVPFPAAAPAPSSQRENIKPAALALSDRKAFGKNITAPYHARASTTAAAEAAKRRAEREATEDATSREAAESAAAVGAPAPAPHATKAFKTVRAEPSLLPCTCASPPTPQAPTLLPPRSSSPTPTRPPARPSSRSSSPTSALSSPAGLRRRSRAAARAARR